MFEKKLNPNPAAVILANLIFFAAGFFLLNLFPSEGFKTLGLFGAFLTVFLSGLSPAVPFILSGAAFGKFAGISQSIFFTAMFLVFSFRKTRRSGIDWAIQLRKKHEKFYVFAQEPFKNGFLWAFSNRLLPLIPYDDFNLGAGKSKAGFLPYLSGSLLGLFPQFAVFACWGDALGHFIINRNAPALISAGLWSLPALFLLFVPVFYRHMESWGSEQ